MKKLVILGFMMLLSIAAISQERKKISINFDNINRINALIKLEALTEYEIYFEADWFDDHLISKSFREIEMETIIEEILEDTPVNYLIFEGKVILTKNNAIIDKLPEAYFGKEYKDSIRINNSERKEITKAPILQKQFVRNQIITDGKIYSIGKADNNNNQREYIVSGYIKDSKTNKPIDNLVVFIKDRNINTTTDTSGFYSMEVPVGYNEVETSSLSYGKTKRTIIVYGNGTLSFTMDESAELLDEIVIESDKDDNIRKAEVGVTKIDVQGIKNIPLVMGERDVLKVATTMPGIKAAGEGLAWI